VYLSRSRFIRTGAAVPYAAFQRTFNSVAKAGEVGDFGGESLVFSPSDITFQ
jgi:hypothetical protein